MEQKWIVLDDEGWKIVMPETDTKAHSSESEGSERELAWSKCPCKPKVDFAEQMIVHNSFQDMKKVDEAMEKLNEN